MPFEIYYGAWIKETSGNKTILMTVSEEEQVSQIKESIEKGLDVDQAFKEMKQRIIAQLRRL